MKDDCLRATFRIVTPMFLGGAMHEAERIRGTAVKGALAFWWRAFHFAGFVREAGDVGGALGQMRARERVLFGSSEGGQGRFLIRLRHGELSRIDKGQVLRDAGGGRGGGAVGVGARYLGYGLMETFGRDAGKLERNCLAAGQSFDIDILFRPGTGADDKAQIATALKLLGLLGGLGARVRRGWGALALERLGGCGQDWRGPQGREEYAGVIGELFENHPGTGLTGTGWPLTAFGRESGVWLGESDASGLAALDRLGRAMLNYRGMGRGGETSVGGQPILKQFTEDHDWFRKGANGVDIPYRSAFGLPHMYDSKRNLGVTPDNSDRRASPLLLHVHQAGSTSFAVATLLPTMFLDQKVKAHRQTGKDAHRAYELGKAYGGRQASGLDVLRDFLGAGDGKFTPNRVLRFERVGP